MPAEGTGWDIHAHLVPRTVVDAARQGVFGLDVEGDLLATPSLRVPLGRIGEVSELLGWVETSGLEGALVSVPPPLFRPDLTGGEKLRWVEVVNSGLEAACEDERLRPIAYIPAEDPLLAADIVSNLSDTWVGVTIGTELGSLVYSDPSFEPLWKTAAARSLPMLMHPGVCRDVRLGAFYLSNLLGNPYETAVAAAHLVFGDVLGRHPGLSVVLAHGGGVAAAVVGRWQRGADTSRPGIESMTLTPREALGRFGVDTLVHDQSYLHRVVEVFSVDSVMFGSDWPFPMGTDSVESSLGGLDLDARRKILGENARLRFGLGSN